MVTAPMRCSCLLHLSPPPPDPEAEKAKNNPVRFNAIDEVKLYIRSRVGSGARRDPPPPRSLPLVERSAVAGDTRSMRCPHCSKEHVQHSQAVRQGQRQNAREEHRGRKTNLTVTLYEKSFYSARFDGSRIVLRDNKLWVDVREDKYTTPLHPFTGYYLPFPDNKQATWREQGYHRGEGLVTTISVDPPFLNWVYVDGATHEVKYGVRADAEKEGNFVGPFDCTKVEKRLTLEGWEGFVAVEETEKSGLWALYFDRHDDALQSGGRIGSQDKRMLALEVWRKELRIDRTDAVQERIERLRAREEVSSSDETTVS